MPQNKLQQQNAIVLCVGPGRPPIDVQLREKLNDPCIADIALENVQHHTYAPYSRDSCVFISEYLEGDLRKWRQYCLNDGDNPQMRGPCDHFHLPPTNTYSPGKSGY